jgi:hypothetical protein
MAAAGNRGLIAVRRHGHGHKKDNPPRPGARGGLRGDRAYGPTSSAGEPAPMSKVTFVGVTGIVAVLWL